MSNKTHTVMISLDYHGADEISTRHETTMTHKEMRSLMVYLGRRTTAAYPHENCAIAATRIYYMLQEAERAITDEEETIRGPLGNPGRQAE